MVFLNNSELIRDIRAKFAIANLPQSPYVGQNSDGGISDFRISGQSLLKVNCRNFRTSNAIDMKLGPVTKLETRNQTTSKTFVDEVMSAYSVKLTLSLTITFYLSKTESRTKKYLTQFSHYSLE